MSDTLGFPVDFVEALKDALERRIPDHKVLQRPLRPGDPSKHIGIFVVDTIIQQDKSAMIGQLEPTMNLHRIHIQNLISAADEATGRALFAVACKKIRVVLYRDADLDVSLHALTEDFLNTREVVKRFGVARQRFVNTDVKGVFAYVATTEFWIETEVVKL